VEIDPTIIASYTEAGASDLLQDHHPSDSEEASAAGQTFTNINTNVTITSVIFNMNKYGSPTGNGYAVLYAISNYIPTGSPLATSESLDVSTLTTSFADIEFAFNESEQYIMQSNTQYGITFQNPSTGTINGLNYLRISKDSTSPTHEGNHVIYKDGIWNADSHDLYFILNGSYSPIIEDVEATTAFSLGSYGWVNATVMGGGTYLDTVTITANNSIPQNFTLRWNQTTDTFSEISDPDSICEMTGSIRENIDNYTDKIAFRFRLGEPTNETDFDVEVIAINDDGLNDTQVYPKLFAYVGIEWDPIGDLINSAFSLFGISGYMTQAINFVSEISAHFTNSITSLVLMINLQFQIIWNVFSRFMIGPHEL